jgi:hypothetical protein
MRSALRFINKRRKTRAARNGFNSNGAVSRAQIEEARVAVNFRV